MTHYKDLKDQALACSAPQLYIGRPNFGRPHGIHGSIILLRESELINVLGNFEVQMGLAQEGLFCPRAYALKMLISYADLKNTTLFFGINSRSWCGQLSVLPGYFYVNFSVCT